MFTLQRFRRLDGAVACAGYGETIGWAESIRPPADADAFAREAIYDIANSCARTSVALQIVERCLGAVVAAPWDGNFWSREKINPEAKDVRRSSKQ